MASDPSNGAKNQAIPSTTAVPDSNTLLAYKLLQDSPLKESSKQLLVFLKRNPQIHCQSSMRISTQFNFHLVRNHIRNRGYSYQVVFRGLQELNRQRYIYMKET